MKIVIVCSGTRGILSPFIKEQMDSLSALDGNELLLFQIRKKGWIGYLMHLIPLLRIIKEFKPDLIHAHYGLSGLLANLQRKVPVITTFHGSDLNNSRNLKFSKLAHKLSSASIFVEKKLMDKFKKHHGSSIIPCGVDLSTFHPVPKLQAREILHLRMANIYILFSSVFSNPVKNYPLARKSCDMVANKIGQKVNLIELKGLSRESVNLFMNASDCCLLFSTSEGSPQFIKEAMACNCPIVATNVGDVDLIFGETAGCFITTHEIDDVVSKIIMVLNFSKNFDRTEGRDRILSLQLNDAHISKRIMEVYCTVIN